AQSYGYTLLDKPTEDPLRFSVQRGDTELTPKPLPFAESNAEKAPYSEYGTASFRNQQIGEPKPLNSDPPRFTEKQSTPNTIVKNLCRSCREKKYQRIRHTIISDKQGPSCEDCGKTPSEIQVRITP